MQFGADRARTPKLARTQKNAKTTENTRNQEELISKIDNHKVSVQAFSRL